jgi:CRISPR/Cas system CMR-associated protein Cmr5 small subunit
MLHKKNFVFFLLSIFAFISTNGLGKDVSSFKTEYSKTKKYISQDKTSSEKESFTNMNGILQVLIKANESNRNTFPNFKSNKKRFYPQLELQWLLHSKPCSQSYCSKRVNIVNASHLYIAFRSLII